jgi:methoxymalonate biosynthesis acyl carrier protein
MSTLTDRAAASEAISANVAEFVARQTKNTVTADVDLFGSGLVSSLFAMQLVAHVESTFGLTVQGPDLKLANFRTIAAITDLVLRLRGNSDA